MLTKRNDLKQLILCLQLIATVASVPFPGEDCVLSLSLVMIDQDQQNQGCDHRDLLRCSCSFRPVSCNLNVHSVTASVYYHPPIDGKWLIKYKGHCRALVTDQASKSQPEVRRKISVWHTNSQLAKPVLDSRSTAGLLVELGLIGMSLSFGFLFIFQKIFTIQLKIPQKFYEYCVYMSIYLYIYIHIYTHSHIYTCS